MAMELLALCSVMQEINFEKIKNWLTIDEIINSIAYHNVTNANSDCIIRRDWTEYSFEMLSKQIWGYTEQQHSKVILKLLSIARNGTEVKYIPGKHDGLFRQYIGERFGDIKIYRTLDHITADGKKLLVTHGDEYDVFMKESYRFLMNLGDYIHRAAKKQTNDITYLNTGDWMDSCTSLVENYDGIIDIVHWVDEIMLKDNFYRHIYTDDYVYNGNVLHTKN